MNRVKGELHLAKTACEADFSTLYVLSRIPMTESNDLICFQVWPLRETAIRILLCNCLVGA